MVKDYKIKLIAAFTFLLTLLPAPACEEMFELVIVDCNYCYTERPENAEVWLDLSFDSENQYVPVTIYSGSYDDGLIIETDTFTYGENYLYLPVDENYSFKATYKKDGLNYYTINGTKLRTRIDYETCSETCYYITGDEVDLRKKF